MARFRVSRRDLDAWLPTIVRYLGLVVLIYGLVIGEVLTYLPAAAGMWLFKTVYGDGSRE